MEGLSAITGIPSDFLEFENLPLIEAAEAGFLDSRDMDKHIFSAALRLNKSIPFFGN
jgi:hypothetical protein